MTKEINEQYSVGCGFRGDEKCFKSEFLPELRYHFFDFH
jgi:hypothetical protein